MSLSAGSRLGPYEVLAPIGAGGMGEVYKARDTRLTRTVAIKVLPASAAGDASARARFDREARAIATLSHPHICVVYDVGHQDGVDYLVMELLEGETLAERIARAKGPLPLSDVLSIGAAIADALDKAHRAGIVHRDLKPANVMLTKSGPKLLDFGLAKALGWSGQPGGAGGPGGAVRLDRPNSPDRPDLPDPSTLVAPPRLTGAGTILGTIHYMAPEQVEGQEADPRSDIWALGALLYEMATGQRPFEGESPASVLGAILKDTPAPVSSRLPLAPPLFDRTVLKCLTKAREARWQTASDLRDELQWVAESRLQAAAPQGDTRRTNVGRTAWAVAALAGVVALGSFWFSTRGSKAPALFETRLEIGTPPTEEPASFAISPDGRRLVFVASGDGSSRLWLRPLATTTPQPMAGTEGALDPFWSPDGRSIGFFSGGLLKRVDLDGGPPRTLAAVTGARGGAWNADDVIVFAPSQNSPLHRVPASGGNSVPVTTLGEGQQSHRWPSLLPDGRRFLFYVRGSADAAGVWLGDLEGSPPRRLGAADGAAVSLPAGWIAWVRGGELMSQALDAERAALTGVARRLAEGVLQDEGNRSAVSAAHTGAIAYRVGAGGQRQLTWFGRSGAVMGSVGTPDSTYRYVSLSLDGTQVAVSRVSQGNSDIWLLDDRRSIRFTFDPGSDEFPVWAPDGTRLLFRSLRSGHFDMWQKVVAGDEAEVQIAPGDQQKTPLSWSSDGRFILYQNVTDPITGADLFVLPTLESAKPWAFQKTRFTERNGTFSPDGRWVAYQSDESGQAEVYVRPFVGGDTGDGPSNSSERPDHGQGKWQVSTGGGVYPVWRRDGKELYYINPAGVLAAVPIAAAGNALGFGAPATLFSTKVLGGGVENRQGRQYDVAPDGRFLINTVVASVASPITLLQNWKPEAK